MAYIKTDGDAKVRKPLKLTPFATQLKDGTPVTLIRVLPEDRLVCPTTASHLVAVRNLLNYEIAVQGDSYPFPQELTEQQFLDYYAGYELFLLVRDTPAARCNTDSDPVSGKQYDFGPSLVGSFYIKPNYPYRSAQICNGGFLVVPQYKARLGAGELMGRCYVVLAAELGYLGSMFNLVYSTNKGSIRIWEKLGFTQLSEIPNGGKVVTGRDPVTKAPVEQLVSSIQFYADVQKLAPGLLESLKPYNATATRQSKL